MYLVDHFMIGHVSLCSHLYKSPSQQSKKMQKEISRGICQLGNLRMGMSSMSLAALSAPMSTGVNAMPRTSFMTLSLADVLLLATKTSLLPWMPPDSRA